MGQTLSSHPKPSTLNPNPRRGLGSGYRGSGFDKMYPEPKTSDLEFRFRVYGLGVWGVGFMGLGFSGLAFSFTGLEGGRAGMLQVVSLSLKGCVGEWMPLLFSHLQFIYTYLYIYISVEKEYVTLYVQCICLCFVPMPTLLP